MMRQAVRPILAETYRFFSQSRRVYWSAELLSLRMRERRETFGLGRSSQRWTITIFAAYLLNLYISSTSPHRPKVSLLSPFKAEGLSAISASHTYHLCGSISFAALREKSKDQEQHWVRVTLYHLNILASAWLSRKVFGLNNKVTKSRSSEVQSYA